MARDAKRQSEHVICSSHMQLHRSGGQCNGCNRDCEMTARRHNNHMVKPPSLQPGMLAGGRCAIQTKQKLAAKGDLDQLQSCVSEMAKLRASCIV